MCVCVHVRVHVETGTPQHALPMCLCVCMWAQDGKIATVPLKVFLVQGVSLVSGQGKLALRAELGTCQAVNRDGSGSALM